MKIVVCDDNPINREMLIGFIEEYFRDKFISYEIKQFDDGMDLIYEMEEGFCFDIVFLDIYMEHMLGIDVARKLRECGYSGSIVFCSVSGEYAVEGYDVCAEGYIVKPIDFQHLSQVLDRIMRQIDDGVYTFCRRNSVINIPFREILYVDSRNSKCIIHRKDGTDYTVYKRLCDIGNELDDRFLRCHQSYLVNMDYICAADKSFLLVDGESIMISQRSLKESKQAYIDYLNRRKGICL